MGRLLLAAAAFWLGLGPGLIEARDARPVTGDRHAASGGLATGTFSLARGVIGGLVTGRVDRSFVATGNAICFLPGTFDVTVDGAETGDFQPSSHCGRDATVRIHAFGDIATGDEVAREMSIRWTDLAGREFVLQFDGRAGDTSHARVICLDGDVAGCRAATVDSVPRSLAATEGRLSRTGARARLTLVADRDLVVGRALGVYDVPFALAITGG